MPVGPYHFHWYNSFSSPPALIDDLAQPHLDRGGRIRFRIPLADGRTLVVMEFADGMGMVTDPEDQREYKFACPPDNLDALVNLNAITGGWVRGIVLSGGNELLVTMDLLRVPDNSRRPAR